MSKPTKLLSLTGVFLLFIASFNTGLLAQTAKSVEGPVKLLNDYNARFPQEKVYLHTDRKHYAPGEPIWFQAYVAAGYFHEPSPLSNNVYVALFSSNKTLIKQLLVRADVGIGHGVIDLPDDLPGGSYVLRAYTNWMKNFDDDFFFEKELIVIGVEDETTESSPEAFEIDLQFFPEGGHLVDNVASRVAFKSVDKTGRSIAVAGTLYNNEGEEISQFKTEHDGMGVLVFTPKKGQSYTAKIEGSSDSYALPEVQSRGYSIAVNNNLPDVLRLTFRSNDATRKKDQLGVIVHTRGAVVYAFDVDVSKNIAFTNLPKANLPAGIAHITLFDNNQKAILERLVYIDKAQGTVSVKTDKNTYDQREKVSATIEVTDADGNPVSGAFSLSAIDLGQTIDQAPEATIVSDLLLSSDLKGYLANPMYYFDTANTDRKKHLDLVMMTHGWSRFRWDELQNKNQTPANHIIEQGLMVGGRLLRIESTKPADGGKVTLINQESSPPMLLEAEVGNDGKFVFENVIIFDNEELLFQGENKKGRNLVQFELDTLLEVDRPTNFSGPLESQKSDPAALQNFTEKTKRRDLIDDAYNFDSTATDLGTIVVEGDRLAIQRAEEERQGIYGTGDNTIRFVDQDFVGANNPLEMIRGKIAGVVVNGNGDQITVQIRASQTGAGNSLAPLILIDDIPTDVAGITSLPAGLIARVEVFKGPSAAIFGSKGGGGVLAFYTKKGTDQFYKKTITGVLTAKLKNGYNQARDFYAPKYATKKPEHIKPDSRIVLQWQPMILLDESGKARIEFWNSDEETSVLLDLQGITKAGVPLATTLVYKVEKK